MSHKASRMPLRRFDLAGFAPVLEGSLHDPRVSLHDPRVQYRSKQLQRNTNTASYGRFDAWPIPKPKKYESLLPTKIDSRWSPVMPAGRPFDSPYPTRNTSCRLRAIHLRMTPD